MKRILIFTITLLLTTNVFSASIEEVLEPLKADPPQLNEKRELAYADLNKGIPSLHQYGPVRLSAFGNFDINPKTMQKTLPGEEEDYFALSNLGLNTEIDIAAWFHSHVGLAYYKTNKGQADIDENTGLLIDDAYLTIANFVDYAYFLQAGRFYLPFGRFGRYDRYIIAPSLPQMLSEARGEGVQIGVVEWYGFTVTAYVVQGFVVADASKKIQSEYHYGGSLFYNTEINGLRLAGGAQYIFNMLNVNALRQGGVFSAGFTGDVNVYQKRPGGMAAQIEIGYGMVDVYANYVTALRSTPDLILLYQNPTPMLNPIFGAQPSAWDVGMVVKFELYGYPIQVDANYQRSKEAAGLFVFNALPGHPFPKERYGFGAEAKLHKNVFVRVQWLHDMLYPEGEGDTGTSGDNITLRLGVIS